MVMSVARARPTIADYFFRILGGTEPAAPAARVSPIPVQSQPPRRRAHSLRPMSGPQPEPVVYEQPKLEESVIKVPRPPQNHTSDCMCTKCRSIKAPPAAPLAPTHDGGGGGGARPPWL